MQTACFDHLTLRNCTAPQLLCKKARNVPSVTAFRTKIGSAYIDRSWADYARMVAHCAQALAELGLGKGDRLAIIAGAREEWCICDLAAQSLGAIVYGIYPTSAPSEIEYQLRDGGAAIFVAENSAFLDKVTGAAGRLPDLRWLIVLDGDSLPAERAGNVMTFAELLASAEAPSLDWLEQRAARVQPDDPAFIVYTSGTTGDPKGALISHGKHLAAAASLTSHYPTLVERTHSTIAYLPLCHVLGRVIVTTLPLMSKLVPHFGQSALDVLTTLREVRPTVFFTVPRFLQKFASQLLLSVQNSSRTRRWTYRRAMALARKRAARRWAGKPIPLPLAALSGIAQALVFKPLLAQVGFERIDLLVFGGAPVSPELIALWQTYGVNLTEIYGQTESGGGFITGQRPPFPVPGNVGVAPDGWEIKLSEEGEVLVRCPYLFERYWNNDAATQVVKHADGWMRTGDIGEIRAGSLRLIDRARDFIVTSGGKTVSPSFIENILRASPYISEAIVFGHGRKYLTALIEIEFDMIAHWARERGIPCDSLQSALGDHAVEALIHTEVEKANANLGRVEQIKAFRILPKILDPREPGEPITPTRKIKRQQLYERFRTLVDGMYDDEEERLFAVEAKIPLVA